MPAPHQTAANILYVDDTEAQRYALARVLRNAGFEVTEAKTGREALDLISARPDLVVLDVNLPDMSGFQVCREIKAREASARTPVLHVSATMVSTNARVTALEGGADGYLIQPIASEELIATVRALLRVRKAEEALWLSNQQYRQFFEATPLPCLVFDTTDLNILAVNNAAVDKYGYSRQEFTGLNLRNIVVEERRQSLASSVATLACHSMQVRQHRTKSGDLLDVEETWAPLSLVDRNARLVIIQDITEKLKREAAEKEEAVRQLLLQRVLEAQEEERQRLSRELHDETGQLMTSLLIGLRTLSDARRLSDARQQAQRLREITSQAIGELSRLARGLHASILDDLGLEAAVRRYAAEFSSTHNIAVHLHVTANLEALSPQEHLNLYRIIQEALTNVARHAQASEVQIHFEETSGGLHLRISDNGAGLSQTPHETRQHLGIAGMQQRAAMLRGSLKVISEPRQGVTIDLRFPIRHIICADAIA